MRSFPRVFWHVFNSESRKVTFGWWLFIVATWLTYIEEVEETNWLICIILSTILIGGGTVTDEIIKVGRAWIDAKVGGAKPEPAAPAPSPEAPK